MASYQDIHFITRPFARFFEGLGARVAARLARPGDRCCEKFLHEAHWRTDQSDVFRVGWVVAVLLAAASPLFDGAQGLLGALVCTGVLTLAAGARAYWYARLGDAMGSELKARLQELSQFDFGDAQWKARPGYCWEQWKAARELVQAYVDYIPSNKLSGSGMRLA